MNADIMNTIWMELMLIIGLYLQYYFFRRSSLLVEKKYFELFPYLIFFLWVNIAYLFGIPTGVKLLVQVVIFVLAARLVYDVKLSQIITKSLLYLFILSASELIVVQLWDIFDPTPLFIEYGDEKSVLYYSLQLAIYIFAFGIIYIIDNIFFSKKKKGFYMMEDLGPFIISMASYFVINFCIFFNMEFVEDNKYTTVFFICSVFILFTFIYNANIYSKRLEKKQKEQEEKIALFEMEMQRDFFQQKMIDEENIRAIYHDFKNHLLVLEEDDSDEKKAVLKELREKVSGYDDYLNSGNKYLDIILKEKRGLARAADIEVIVSIDIESIDFISSIDISSIFGNLFDNAIEACKKIENGSRFIELKIKNQNRLLVISMKNSKDKSKEEVDYHNTSKKQKMLHGFGIKNIIRSLQKYEGYYSIKQSEEEFVFKITIPFAD